MNSVNMNSQNDVKSVDVFIDIIDMNSIFSE